jgi:hypothetical protein
MLVHATAARAEVGPPAPEQPRSVGVAYALALGGTLAPLYAAKAIDEGDHEAGLPAGARAAVFAGICAGPSLGYAYGGSWRYALGAAAIKSAIVGGALWADARTDDGGCGHAWLSTFAAVTVAAWSTIDLVRLGRVVDENNRAAAARPLALAPLVTAGRGTGGAGAAGGGLVLVGSF